MKRKLVTKGPSGGPSHLVGKSIMTPTDTKIVEEPKPTHAQEAEGESYLNKSFLMSDILDIFRRHPFTDYVMGAQLPLMWKGLSIDRYDGTTNPDEHMDVYTMHTSLYTLDSAVLYRVFSTSLKGGALSWFTRLPPNSVDCFETLVSKFGTQFAISRPHHLSSIALVNIQQEKEESLRLFMERFNKVTLNIQNQSSDVAMHYMVTTLWPGPFVDSLCKNPKTNLDELRQKPTKCMQLKGLRKYKSHARAETSSDKGMEKEK